MKPTRIPQEVSPAARSKPGQTRYKGCSCIHWLLKHSRVLDRTFLFTTLISHEITIKYASQSQQMFKVTLWSSVH